MYIYVTVSAVCVQYGTALYKNYQAAMKRASPTKTLQSAAHKGKFQCLY